MVRERREKAKQVREKQTMRGHRGQKGIERERERERRLTRKNLVRGSPWVWFLRPFVAGVADREGMAAI